MTPNRTPKTPHEVSPPGLLLVGVDSALAEVIRARMDPIPVVLVETIDDASREVGRVRPMLVVVSGDEDMASLEEVAPACGADVIRIEELQDVPRALERLVITLTRGRSGQYTASGPARVHADRDDGWHPPLPESPAPAPVASPKDPDAAQAVPARARISNVALFKDDDLRSVRGGLTGDPDAELVITLEEPGKVLVARDRQGQTLRIEGVMTVKKGGLGEVRFVGDVDLDTSGVTPIRGTLVFDLAKSVSIKVRGQVHPRTHKARAGTKVALVF